MIKLSNGYSFKYASASGALGYRGDGWPPVETLYRWFRILKPNAFTHITKTLTLQPLKGRFSWWRPWVSVRYIRDGMVNAIALTNPGLAYWINHHYPKAVKRQRKLIVSLAPSGLQEACTMAGMLNLCPEIVGIELNPFCPNKAAMFTPEEITDLVKLFRKESLFPLGIKLGWQDPYIGILKSIQYDIDFVDLINACPWDNVFPFEDSPLSKYGYKGSVSGLPITWRAREALQQVKAEFPNLNVLSGGGIYNEAEARLRFSMGADAVSFGTIFSQKWFTNCAEPNRIVKALETSSPNVPQEQELNGHAHTVGRNGIPNKSSGRETML